MFMRFRGGGVGHKSTRKATCCVLDDHDALDKASFTFEHDQPGQGAEEDDEDGVSMDDASNDGEGDISMDEASSSEEEGDQEGPGTEVADIRSGEQLVGNELADEMDEYGYTGLDQVVESDDEDVVEDVEDINDGDDTAY